MCHEVVTMIVTETNLRFPSSANFGHKMSQSITALRSMGLGERDNLILQCQDQIFAARSLPRLSPLLPVC